MDVVELAPSLFFLPFPVGHAYLSVDRDGLTLIDTGLPGSAPRLAAAIRHIGRQPGELRQVVLTHGHADHAGAAAEVSAWAGAAILAGQADAPFLRSGAPLPAPDLADWERPIYDQLTRQLPATPLPPVRVDQELRDGDELDFGGGAVTIAVPGHTPGSIACYLPQSRVLIAGDAIARRPDGRAMLGVFNVDPAQAAASLARLATLDTEIVCAGHGDPITTGAAAFLRAAMMQYGAR
jgi:glyoxylase-like metal-dependent hydrolase (beta-lactamase superfamily II)